MWRRSAVVGLVLGLVAVACSSGDDTADTIPEVTLLTTTTEAPLVVETEPSATAAADTTTTSTTTTTSSTTTTTSTTTTVPDPTVAQFTLESTGLGSTSFGADPDATIAFISSFLGDPTRDTGWQDAFSFGACIGAEIRQVNWGNLQLEFGDASNVTSGRRHFTSYIYGVEGSNEATPPGLVTFEGIGVGSTVGDLIATYPGVEIRFGDEFINDFFIINDNLSGRLSGVTDSDIVQVIIGGLPCEG